MNGAAAVGNVSGHCGDDFVVLVGNPFWGGYEGKGKMYTHVAAIALYTNTQAEPPPLYSGRVD